MTTSDNILHFPDRSLLKLIDAVNGVLTGSTTAIKALEVTEEVLQSMGAVKDENGQWQLPESQE